MDLNIAPLGFSNDYLLRRLILTLSHIFREVKVFYPLINVENSYSITRRQYHSTHILESVIKSSASTQGYHLILTELDLFVPVLTYIFGEAQLKGRYSIVSLRRLHEEFYSEDSNDEILFERTRKEVLHELGHNFGLHHCIDWDCVMHSSNNVEEVDIKGEYYCRFCVNEIRENNIAIPEFIQFP